MEQYTAKIPTPVIISEKSSPLAKGLPPVNNKEEENLRRILAEKDKEIARMMQNEKKREDDEKRMREFLDKEAQ